MTDHFTACLEASDTAGSAEPVSETSALRAHIARILRKAVSAKSRRPNG
jgi:hypothetical protein